jgi:biotin synthase-like enzyme
MDFIEQIKQNNLTHTIDKTELEGLIIKASRVFTENHSNHVWFERSVFINWTCGIADCKYCYLSTKPKKDMKSLRSQASILAELLLCKLMGWRVGYLTGGLRVESTEYMVELLDNASKVLGYKPMMNFGPYTRSEIVAFKPHISGIGAAIESFDPELHSFICPSKPLKMLQKMLEICKEENVPTFITIILGMGEKKDDVFEVIKYVKQYDIAKVQLCFLKPQVNTVFSEVPPPDPYYMAWWTAQLRIACPSIQIKIALIKERMADFALMLKAGANSFSRSLIFREFGTSYAQEIVAACTEAGRELDGEFLEAPILDIASAVAALDLPSELKAEILPKAEQYYKKLK